MMPPREALADQTQVRMLDQQDLNVGTNDSVSKKMVSTSARYDLGTSYEKRNVPL